MKEKLEDRVVYCLVMDENEDIDLKIKRLCKLEQFDVNVADEPYPYIEDLDVWLEEIKLTCEERARLIENDQCGSPEYLGETINAWYTFEESELWAWVESLLSINWAICLQGLVDRLVQFKIDGKFDGEEE